MFNPDLGLSQPLRKDLNVGLPRTVLAQLSTVPMKNAYGLSRLFSTCFRLHLDFVVNGARFSQWESREAVWGAVNKGPWLRVLSWGSG